MSRFAEEVSKLSKPRLALLCVELQRELEAQRQSRSEPIAVIGIGCRLPGGVNGPAEFWRLLENGVDAIAPIPGDRWDVDAFYDPSRSAPGKMYTREGGFLERVDEFDPEFFGISPREARHMDPQHRILLEVTWEALEHAGIPPDQLSGSRTGVFVGIGNYDYATWQTIALSQESINAYTGTGNAFCFASGRLSYVLGLHGPSVALDVACATSLVTVHLACQSLRAGECTLALAGGVNLMLVPMPTIFLAQAQALAPDGRCKTFDASADGYGRSEGCGMVVLKRLSDAIAAGDPVLAVIRGSAVNHDGRSAGLTVPNGVAQQAVIREAVAQAAVAPEEISYIEAHGTGTVLGDPIEVRALAGVLGNGKRQGKPLWIGSVKTNIGHCEVAAGVTSLTKVVLALQHRTIPPHLHFRQPNPHLSLDQIPAHVPTSALPWPETNGRRIAGVNAFGLSGTNAHLVVEEFRPPEEEPETERDLAGPCVLALSARDAWSLGALAAAWDQALAPGGLLADQPLRDICYTATARRSHHRHRWAAVVHSIDDARRKIGALASKTTAAAPSTPATPRREHKVAFAFSGQGSQWWAMGRELMTREPVFREAIEECLGIFATLGDTLVREAFQSDEASSRIADTEVAQPALFTVQVAIVRLLASWGLRPDAVVGHSVGEIAAAHVAGALSLRDAARLALARGRVMQQATGKGRMAAVQLSPAEAAAIAARFDGRLSVAAINSPSSAVLSGEPAAMTAALAELEDRGVWQRLLPVNYAFHSYQMWPSRGELLEALDGLTPLAPSIPIISTVTGREMNGATFDAAYWGRNVVEPVQFAAAVTALIADRYDVFVEIGPHPVLQHPVVDSLEAAGQKGTVLSSLRRGVDERAAMLDTLASLYSLGLGVDWRGLYRGRPRVVQLPRYPWHRRRMWVEADASGGYRRADAAGARAVPAPAPEPAEDASPAARHERVLSYVHSVEWEVVERTSAAHPDEAGAWVIFGDRRGTGAAVANALGARGIACDLVYAAHEGFEPPAGADVVDSCSATAIRDVLRARRAARDRVTGIVYLWGLDADADADVSQRLAYGGLVNIIQALGPAGWNARQLWIVTRGSQPAVAGAAPLAVVQAPLWGMARTIPLELPGITCVAVDLDPADEPENVAALSDEIALWDGVDQVALRGAGRYVPRIRRTPAWAEVPEAPSPRLAADATYLITGGTGGIGLEVARWMVGEGARHVVLVGRSAPSTQVTGELEAFRSGGADVQVMQGDVAVRDDVARIIGEIDRTLPPLKGVVHAAGINEVGFIERQPWDKFAAVFPVKVEGTRNLDALTASHALDFFVLFSSTASLFGALGQANYVAANSFLDAFSYDRRARGLPSLTINWGPWGEVGMVSRLPEQVRQRWAAQGASMMRPADAVATLGHLLGADTPQAIAIAIDWPTFVASSPKLERMALFSEMAAAAPRRGEPAGAAQYAELRDRLARAKPDEAATLVFEFVQQQFADALGFESAESVDPDTDFLALGVDSLMATRVMLTLNEAFEVTLPMTLMFEHPTITALAAEVDRVRTGGGAKPAATGAGSVGSSGPREARIPHVDSTEPAPLSSAQEAVWSGCRIETDEPVHHEALVLRLEGELDEGLLRRALDEIVRRHETLRTVFQGDNGATVQAVRPPAPIDLVVEDCGGSGEPGIEWLRSRVTGEARAPFALDSGPLLRARLLRVGPAEHVLLLVGHQLVVDRASYGVLARELAALYKAYSAGAPSLLPELAIQYGDFARWQRSRLAAGELNDALAYWRQQLADVPSLEWPGDTRERRSSAAGSRSFAVAAADEATLVALGEHERATAVMTLLATYIAWLYRHTHQTDFAVGLPVAGRSLPETEPLIGPLTNVLPIRTPLTGSTTFRELVARVREKTLEALAHQDLPLTHAVQTVFVENTSVAAATVPGLRMDVIPVDPGISRFDLTLTFARRGAGLEGVVEYNASLFDELSIVAMIQQYQQLVASALADPDRPLAELSLVPAGEGEEVHS